MAQKSNWFDSHEDDGYWAESQQNAFDFNDDEENVSISKSIAKFDKPLKETSDNSNKFGNQINSGSNTNKKTNLKSSYNLDEKQIEDCLSYIEEEKKLSSNLETITSKTTPKEAIDRMVRGMNVLLNVYKGKDEKLQLLDLAVDSNDGNVITTVVTFVQKTLKPNIFNYELSKRSIAADHYIYYLQQTEQTNELVDVLAMLGRHEDAAMVLYKQSISIKNIETKIRNLKSCVKNHFTSGGPNILFWNSIITEQISLLERQLPIEMDDSKAERQQMNQYFVQIPRNPIIDLPAISTLYYCCLYHYDLTENNLASPKSICKAHQLSQKQFLWTALLALAKCKRWADIDALFEYKSWLGNKKIKSFIPFDMVLLILKKNEAKQEMLVKYIELIDDYEIKINLAKELELHRIAIDTLIKVRDRKRLEEYASKINRQSEEYAYALNAIKSVKWKN